MVLAQTFKKFELLVVDDGSTDQSVEKLREIEDSRLNIVQKINGGVSSARNYGIKKAKYNYVAFLDADDRWHENHLENIVMLIENFPDAEVFAANFELVFSDEKKISLNKNIKTGYIDYFYLVYKKKKPIHSSAFAAKKIAFKEAGYFDEKMIMGEDIDMWRRFAKNCKIAYCSEISASYVQETENNINGNPTKLPHPYKTFPYYIKFKNIDTVHEFKYLKKQIVVKTINYAIKYRRVDYFFIMLKKHWKNYFCMYKRYFW